MQIQATRFKLKSTTLVSGNLRPPQKIYSNVAYITWLPLFFISEVQIKYLSLNSWLGKKKSIVGGISFY